MARAVPQARLYIRDALRRSSHHIYRESKERYVAIKILTAAATRADAGDIDMYHRFHDFRVRTVESADLDDSDDEQPHPGFAFCVEPLAVASTESPHGLHRCIVTPVYGSTVDDLQMAQPGTRFKLSVVKDIVRQTLLALDFLHTVMDVVHAGTQ